jgi:hypothetical protein
MPLVPPVMTAVYPDAAAELSVTPAAIGQQVRALEALLVSCPVDNWH